MNRRLASLRFFCLTVFERAEIIAEKFISNLKGLFRGMLSDSRSSEREIAQKVEIEGV